MPCIAYDGGARIFEWMVLQAFRGHAHARAPRQQELSIHRDEVRHWAPLPIVVVHPEPAVHGVDHAVAAFSELPPSLEQRPGVLHGPNYWQATRPSAVVGAGGEATVPIKIAQVSGKDCGWVTFADQPDPVAETMVRITPGDEFSLRSEVLSA